MKLDAKILKKILQTAPNNILKRSYNMIKWDPRDARMVQYSQIHKHNTSHKQKERQKSHNHIKRCGKTI